MESIDIVVSGDVVTIYINNSLHISFKKSTLMAIQSFKEDKGLWSIEYYLTNNVVILSEYDRRDRWITILKKLEEKCLLHLDK